MLNEIEVVKRTQSHWGGETKLKNCKAQGVKGFLLDSMGTDHFPVEAAKRMGFVVRWLPDYCSSEVADFSLFQLFMLKRRIAPDFPECTREKVCLVIGSEGNVGKKVVELFKGAGNKVVGYDLKIPVDKGFFDYWLERAKLIVFCCDLNPSSEGLLKTRHFRLMWNKPFVLNPVGRLGLVSLKLIKKYLDKDVISGYACDEFVKGPLAKDLRCFFSGHTAWRSNQSKNRKEKVLKQVRKEIERVLS